MKSAKAAMASSRGTQPEKSQVLGPTMRPAHSA